MQQYQKQQFEAYLSSYTPTSSMYSSSGQQQQHGVLLVSSDQRQTVIQTSYNNSGAPCPMAQVLFPQQHFAKKSSTPQIPETDPLSLQVKKRVQKKKRKSLKPSPRSRTTITDEQRAILMKAYTRTSFPKNNERRELGLQTKLGPRQVQIWFQNMRSKEKKLSGAPKKDKRGGKPKVLNFDLDC